MENNNNNNNNPNPPLEGEVQSLQRDIVGFTDAGNVTINAGREQSFISAFESVLPDVPNKDITTILSRYSRHGVIDPITATGPLEISLSDLISGMGAYTKLDGFTGFTGTFSVKLVWNTEPFTQGMYILGYLPPRAPMERGGTAEWATHRAVYLSGCHNVMFNLAEATSVQLDIPYVGPNTFIPCGKAHQALLGSFYLLPISQARSTATLANLSITVYFAIKDCKTYGAYPAGAAVSVFTEAGEDEANAKADTYASLAGSTRTFLEKAGRYVPSSLVPAEFFKVADWALGGTQKVLDLLGLSKPFSPKAMQSVAQLPYKDITTSDCTFEGAKMAMNIDAGLGKVDLSGRGVDEMQISEVLSRPNLLPFTAKDKVSVWGVHDTVGKELRRIDLTPTSMMSSFVWNSNSTYYINTHMSYLASAFAKWRGSINLRIVPVCTKFHSGRLRVHYLPYDTRTPVMASTQYSYCHVIDIRDPTTWEFEVPFIVASPWLGTDQSSGTVRILVDSPLVGSGSASDTIDLACFVSGGTTFELAVPTPQKVRFPVVWEDQPKPQLVETEAGVDDPLTERVMGVSLAPEANSSSVTAHSLAVGDPIRSLRAIFRKFWTGNSETYTMTTEQYLLQYPFPLLPYYRGNPRPTTGRPDPITYFGHLFAFWRGGVRLYCQNYYPARVMTETVTFPSDESSVNGRSLTLSTGFNTSFPVGMTEPVKVELPYSFKTLCRNTFRLMEASELGHNDDTCEAMKVHYYLGSVKSVFYRAMADDFDMGWLIGAPMTV